MVPKKETLFCLKVTYLVVSLLNNNSNNNNITLFNEGNT